MGDFTDFKAQKNASPQAWFRAGKFLQISAPTFRANPVNALSFSMEASGKFSADFFAFMSIKITFSARICLIFEPLRALPRQGTAIDKLYASTAVQEHGGFRIPMRALMKTIKACGWSTFRIQVAECWSQASQSSRTRGGFRTKQRGSRSRKWKPWTPLFCSKPPLLFLRVGKPAGVVRCGHKILKKKAHWDWKWTKSRRPR